MVVSCSRWFGFRLDLLSSVFITIVEGTAILITENSGEFRQYVPLCKHGHVVLCNELTEPRKTETEVKLII